MDIRNVSNHGNNNVDRVGDRAKRPEARRADAQQGALRGSDDARISATGRETAAAVEQLAERARAQGDDREAVVEAARQKLLSGELDSPAVLSATAQRLADRGFLS